MTSAEISLSLFAAGIALISSLITLIITSLINYYLSKKSKRIDKVEKLHYLIGKTSSDVAKSEDLIDLWRSQKTKLESFISVSDDNDLVVMIGLLESLSDEISKLKDQIDHYKKEKQI